MSWQTERVKMRDPYRKGRETDIIEFAAKEGVKEWEVRSYYYRHGRTLEGFRERRRRGKVVEVKWKGKTIRGSMVEVAKAMGEDYSKVRNYVAREGSLAGYEANAGRRYWAKVKLPDGREEYLVEYAARMGVSPNVVQMYKRYHGSLEGFEDRKTWRREPPKHRHEGLGLEKTKAEWAEYYGVTKASIREWVRKHGGKMDGYREGAKDKQGNGCRGKPEKGIEWKGKTMTMREWADKFKVSYATAYNYWKRNGGTFDGIEKGRKRGRKTKEVA